MAQEQVLTPTLLTIPRYLSDTCTKETVLRALGERGKEMAKQDEDPAVSEKTESAQGLQAAQGRGPDCSGMRDLHLGFWESREASISSWSGLGLCRDPSARRAEKMQAARNPRSP